jgi:superfamily II DNA or RNA helicase
MFRRAAVVSNGAIYALLRLQTVADLRETCRDLKLAVSGNGSVLMERIAQHVDHDAEALLRKGAWKVEYWRELVEAQEGVQLPHRVDAIIRWATNASAAQPSKPRDLPSLRSVDLEVIPTTAPPPKDLHDFQRAAVKALDTLRRGEGGILELPTGGGKTKTAVWWMLELLAREGGRVLWLAGRDELLDAAAGQVRAHASLLRERVQSFTMRTIKGGASDALDGDVLIASVHTFARRAVTAEALDRHGKVTVVVFDEAHHAVADTFRAILTKYIGLERRRLLGLTATPVRTNPSENALLWKLFSRRVLYGVSYVQLMHRGFLARPKHVIVPHDGKPIPITPERAAYIAQWRKLPEDLLQEMVHDASRLERIVRVVEARADELKPMLVFAIDVNDAKRIHARLRRRLRVGYIDGETPDAERKQLIEGLEHARQLDAIVNVVVLTEGTDIPSLRGVVIARPTMSPSLYRQMVGRGSRGPLMQGTAEFTVVDFDQNFTRFGEQLAYRFALEAEAPAKREPSAPRPGNRRDPRVPSSAETAVRAYLGELASTWSHVPTVDELRLVGWWSWEDGEFTEYLIAFELHLARLLWAIDNLRERVVGLPDDDTAIQAARFLWEERLSETVPFKPWQLLAVALRRGIVPTFTSHTLVEPDLLALYREAQTHPDPAAWLGALYDANPLWALHYWTRDTFVAAAQAVAERTSNHDTVEGLGAFQIPKG